MTFGIILPPQVVTVISARPGADERDRSSSFMRRSWSYVVVVVVVVVVVYELL
jgi:hypothetical protein